MRQWKRMAALLLAAVLVLGLAACNGSPSSSTPGSTPSGTTSQKDLQVSEEFLESLRGQEFTRVYAWELEDPDPEDEGYKYRKSLEEKYGFTFTDIGMGGNYVDAMVTTLLAKKPFGDILMCPEGSFAEWFTAGVMTDLQPAANTLGIDFTDDLYEQNIRRYTGVNGGQYGFGYQEDFNAYVSIYYNKRILRENGCEDPFELRDKGEWTFDKLAEMAAKCKKVNADGTVAQWGLGSWTDSELMIALVNGNDGTIVSLNENRQLQLDLKSSRTMEALDYMYRWCNVDKIVNVSEGGWQKTMQDFVDGKYAFCLGTNQVMPMATASGMKDEFGIITFPVGPSNTSGQTDYTMNYRFWFIPTCNASKAEQLLFVDDLYHRDDPRTFEEKFEKYYLLKIADERSYEDYLERSRKAQKYELFSYAGITYADPGLYGIAVNIFTGQSTPGATVEAMESSLKAVLRDQWDGITFNG